MKPLLFLYLVLVPSAAWGLPCQFFMLQRQGGVAYPCDLKALERDSDRDGTPDWKRHPLFGSLLFPEDDDADGDGVVNLLDPHPFAAERTDRRSLTGFPSHLLSRQQGGETASLQKSLHALSGIYAVSYSAEFSPQVLRALITLFTKLGPAFDKNLSRLKYIFSFQHLDGDHVAGLYLEPIDAIALRGDLGNLPEAEIYSILAHELGHALLFSQVSPSELSALAETHAGWQIRAADDLYAPEFLSRYQGINIHKGAFPSSYAYANSHEWYAENFTHFVLKALGLKAEGTGTMMAYFRELLARHPGGG